MGQDLGEQSAQEAVPHHSSLFSSTVQINDSRAVSITTVTVWCHVAILMTLDRPGIVASPLSSNVVEGDSLRL